MQADGHGKARISYFFPCDSVTSYPKGKSMFSVPKAYSVRISDNPKEPIFRRSGFNPDKAAETLVLRTGGFGVEYVNSSAKREYNF